MKMGEIRPQPRSFVNEVDANLHVNVGNLEDKVWIDNGRIEDNKMWIDNGRTSSYDPHPPQRRYKQLPISSHQRQSSWWKDPEVKRKYRVAKYKLYGSQGRFKCSLKAGIRWFKI